MDISVQPSLPLPVPSIAHLLQFQAVSSPQRIALAAPHQPPITYKQLYDHIGRVGRALRDFGIARNDRVAMIIPNGAEMAGAFLAVAASATSAPLKPDYQASELNFYLTDLEAKALIVSQKLDTPARDVARHLGIPIMNLVSDHYTAAGLFNLHPEDSLVRAHTVESAHQLECATPEDIALVLHTSGTTSRPKLVPLSHANICASARHIGASLKLDSRDCCLNVMPLFHIHGLIAAVLASLYAGGSVVCTPGLRIPEFFAWLADFRPTWYTAVPTIHQAVLAHAPDYADTIRRFPLRLIRSSSAPLPVRVMRDLESVFRAPIIEAYGMTEAAHQIASNPLPPSQQKPGSVGLPAGPEVAILDERGNVLPPGTMGEIAIRGVNVMAGYTHNPAANQVAFVNGWFRTGDQGYIDKDSYLFITGRLKELINRGGEKISPREVDEVLLEHPAVAQAVTFAVPHTTLGEEVAAAIVLQPHLPACEEDIRTFAAARLAYYKVPKRIVFLAEIPKGPTGKLQRIGLAEQLGLHQTALTDGQSSRTIVPPSTPLETMILRIWVDVLRSDVPFGVQDRFVDLGGNSLLAIQIVARLRAELQIEMPLLLFFETPTIVDMAVQITQLLMANSGNDEISQLLGEIEALSDEQAQSLLNESSPSRPPGF